MTGKKALDMLAKLGALIQSTRDPDTTPSLLLKLTREVIPWRDATLYLYDSGDDCLKRSAQSGREVNLILPVDFELGKGLAAWVARRRRPLLLTDIQRLRERRDDPLRSFISVPLVVEEELVGVLNFGHPEPHAFDGIDLDMLAVLGSQAALIIRNLELVKRLRRSHAELQRSYAQLRRMQAQLLEQEQLATISRLVTTLNHEINNPLTAIAGNAELLAAQLEGNENACGKLQTILDEAHKLGRILQQLVNMQRPVVQPYLDDSEMFDLAASATPVAEAEILVEG